MKYNVGDIVFPRWMKYLNESMGLSLGKGYTILSLDESDTSGLHLLIENDRGIKVSVHHEYFKYKPREHTSATDSPSQA